MVVARITLLVYGALLLVGGAVGYGRGKSFKSLVGGLVGAVLSGVSYGLLGMDPRWGLGLGLGTAALGSLLFALRYRKTGKFLPAGLMLGVSLVALLLLGFSFGSV
ncbi:TMEM14 family protein [Synechococcus sp. H65.1]|uniref:TMEM14 family protein n=1 Tax=unclassified Synechococcus TaxID=2626047 RepID=UPI0039C22DEB